MKKYILGLVGCLAAGSVMAQETYESAQLTTQDLNGTAKYVGMGGAMEALGADISTISSNPAGIGLFRKSWAGVSAGITSQGGNEKYPSLNPSETGVTNVDFNQIGFVYSHQIDNNSFINLAVNYHKSRNFNQIINAIGSLENASISKLSFMRLNSLKVEKGWPLIDTRWNYASIEDALTYSVLNDAFTYCDLDEEKNFTEYFEGYSSANRFGTEINNSGYINAFDFNVSGNINNRIFLGLTLGINDVRYKSEGLYGETLCYLNNSERGYFGFANTRRITGTGMNIKFGMIARPLEESPFRIGLYLNTPTWYSLNCYGQMEASAQYDLMPKPKKEYDSFDYSYKIITPWIFGASLGHTIGSSVALGLTYQYSDYGSIKNRQVNGDIITDSYYDSWYDDVWNYSEYYENSTADTQMDYNTKNSLKGVHLLKAGIEIKPVPEVAIRMGYNYESAIYEKNGHKDMMIDASYSTGNYASTYDYTNWQDTHRLTFGLGFALSNNVNLDLSYQFATQKGEYHPFQNIDGITTYWYDMAHSYKDDVHSISANPCSLKNNRHQANMTLSFRF